MPSLIILIMGLVLGAAHHVADKGPAPQNPPHIGSVRVPYDPERKIGRRAVQCRHVAYIVKGKWQHEK